MLPLTPIVTDEWLGQNDLKNHIKTMQSLPLLSVLGVDVRTSPVVTSSSLVITLYCSVIVFVIIFKLLTRTVNEGNAKFNS